MSKQIRKPCLGSLVGETVCSLAIVMAILPRVLFAELDWGMLAGISVGVAVVGLVFWVGLRIQSTKKPGTDPSETTGTVAAQLPPPSLVSRIVSWTSMLYRGSYKGETRSLRRRVGSVDVLLTDPASAGDPVNGWVEERSVHVLTIGATAAFRVGSIVKVRPLNAPDSVPWVEAEVRECEPVDNEWRVVCKFVKIPAYSVLMLFG